MTIVAPVELASRPQWVAWRMELRDNRNTKVPYNARTGTRASSTDPQTWSTFEVACTFCAAKDYQGVGYVLSPEDPYVGIDLDHCRDPETHEIDDWATVVIDRLNSYTEISPSGTGLRIFIRGTLPPHGRRKGPIEIYSQARFLTITGNHLFYCPDTIQDRTVELQAWHMEVFGPPPETRQNGHSARGPVQLADADLLLKARAAANGVAFWALWNGDYSAYGSQSEADLALLNHLAFWTGPDPGRLDGLFRASGLMREKWERQDYRNRTIDKALEGKTEFYGSSEPSPQLVIPTRVDPITGEVLEESPWRSLAEVIEAAPEHDRQLVEGLLWEMRTHWIYSGPGAGKTLLCLALLMHIADESKETFCGHHVKHGPVLLIEEDSPDSVIGEYCEMLADIYEIDLATIPFLTNRIKGVRIMDDAGRSAVQDMILKAPWTPLILALDACERLVPSDRFTSRELEPLSRLLQWSAELRITNIMIDHTRKAVTSSDPIDPIDTLYGGRTKSAISDVMMHISGTIREQALLTFPKFRGVEPTQISVRFDSAKGFTLNSSKPKLSDSERLVMREITNSFGKPLTKKDIAEGAKLHEKATQRALSRLIELGWVDRSGATSASLFGATTAAPGMFS